MPVYSNETSKSIMLNFSLLEASTNSSMSLENGASLFLNCMRKEEAMQSDETAFAKVVDVIIIAFICNHCPYVQNIMPYLQDMMPKLRKNNIAFVAVNSNDSTQYPEDSYDNMRKLIDSFQEKFCYFFDETQEIARLYDAACTPEFFIYNQNRKLTYHGRFGLISKDNSTPAQNELLDIALEIQNKSTYSGLWKQAMGCSIKWRNT